MDNGLRKSNWLQIEMNSVQHHLSNCTRSIGTCTFSCLIAMLSNMQMNHFYFYHAYYKPSAWFWEMLYTVLHSCTYACTSQVIQCIICITPYSTDCSKHHITSESSNLLWITWANKYYTYKAFADIKVIVRVPNVFICIIFNKNNIEFEI